MKKTKSFIVCILALLFLSPAFACEKTDDTAQTPPLSSDSVIEPPEDTEELPSEPENEENEEEISDVNITEASSDDNQETTDMQEGI